jgi:hypothetical protein
MENALNQMTAKILLQFYEEYAQHRDSRLPEIISDIRAGRTTAKEVYETRLDRKLKLKNSTEIGIFEAVARNLLIYIDDLNQGNHNSVMWNTHCGEGWLTRMYIMRCKFLRRAIFCSNDFKINAPFTTTDDKTEVKSPVRYGEDEKKTSTGARRKLKKKSSSNEYTLINPDRTQVTEIDIANFSSSNFNAVDYSRAIYNRNPQLKLTGNRRVEHLRVLNEKGIYETSYDAYVPIQVRFSDGCIVFLYQGEFIAREEVPLDSLPEVPYED